MTPFDIHTHSSISDGTDTPRELVEKARRQGLAGVGLTDHDTLSGWDEAASAADELGIPLLLGVELSTSYRGRSVHLLGFLPDPHDPDLQETMRKVRSSRQDRLKQMVENLQTDFPRISWERLLEANPGVAANGEEAPPWGRPHLADLLVAEGYVPDRSEAFRHLLSPAGPYFVRQWAPDPTQMVATVRRAGGVPILAHPFSAGRYRPLPEAVIADMAHAGLFGLERDHREHDEAARLKVDELAGRYGLATTGGSDYHGTGKPNILGEHGSSAAVIQQIIEQGSTPPAGI